ncbi:TPA: plasmid partition protein ParG [Providencia alcalifaciens]
MALNKQNKGVAVQSKLMSFGENSELKKVISTASVSMQKRINFNTTEEKHQRLKTACARRGISISDIMNELTDSWLKEINE